MTVLPVAADTEGEAKRVTPKSGVAPREKARDV